MSGVTSNTARRARKVATLPATCSVGEFIIKTGANAGFYICLVADAWTGPFDTSADTGDFTGAASSTDNAIVRFDGAGGKTGQNSVVLVGDTGNVTGLGTLNTHTLPAGTDTLVGRASTDTLTNKTLTSPAITTPTGIVKGDVGLGSVDNTTDAAKPVSTAQQTALDLKANDADVVHDTGDETVAGVKTFTSDPIIPDEAYGVGWNGSLEPSTKNAVYDKIETLADTDLTGVAWTAYTPTITTQAGTITTLGTVTGRHKVVGKTVHFHISIPITTNGTGSGSVRATLPFTAAAFEFASCGIETGLTGKGLAGWIPASGTYVIIVFADSTYPGADSHKLVMTGIYERT